MYENISFSLLLSVCYHRCEGNITLGLVARWWSRLTYLLDELLSPQFSEFDCTLPTPTRKRVSQFRGVAAEQSGVPFTPMLGVLPEDKDRGCVCGGNQDEPEQHVQNWLLKCQGWASLVAQWLRIRLPMQGTRVQALGREVPTRRGATKPGRHNYWACALEPVSHNYWSLRT